MVKHLRFSFFQSTQLQQKVIFADKTAKMMPIILNFLGRFQRQHLSAVSAISHNFQFSAQFSIILHSPHNSAYFCPIRTFSHIFLKIALDRIKTKHILLESGMFSSLLIGIWDVFVLADRNLGRFRPS